MGRFTPKSKKFFVSDMIHEIEDILRENYMSKNLRFTYQVNATDEVKSDPERIQ